MALATNVSTSSVISFRGLAECAMEKAITAAKWKAFEMRDKLKFRENLDGTGQYPMWDGSGGKKSKESYSGWNVKQGMSKTGEPVFFLNNPTLGAGGYHYPNILMYGTPESKAQQNPFWKYGPSKNIVKGSDGRLYSKQLPNGIQPWINKQKEVLKNDILRVIKGCD